YVRITFLFLALPATFAMLPPAWTPYLLRQPEFHKQMVIMGLLITADLLAPLWVLIPIQLRGVLFLGLALLPLKSLLAYSNIRPALESLYREPITYGPGFFSSILGMFLLALLGLSLILAHSRRNSKEVGLSA
ncbi:MAG: hypothetical protein GXP38_11300, partial [Chloroflexi bacterium]|nr:hypothetical protein [Chloroflexota bacterium]